MADGRDDTSAAPGGLGVLGRRETDGATPEELPSTLEAAHERIVELTEALAASEKELSTFVYKVSHDLKAPLRAIRSYADFLVEDYAAGLDDEARMYLTRLQVNADLVSAQLLGLLELSRIGRWRQPMQTFDLDGVVEQLVLDAASRAAERNVELIGSSGFPVVVGERRRVLQLFGILVDNAILYRRGDSAGVVSIESVPPGHDGDGFATVVVRDDGIGIEDRHLERVFWAFERLYPKEFDGVGMGLTLAKRIVDYHGGRIWVESTPDEGSAFYVSLPRPPEERGTTTRPEST